MFFIVTRGLHVLPCLANGCWRSVTTVAVDKALLSKLRKSTGISIINCKKALEQFDNDIEKAERWLKEQAQKEGWVKATKLQSRSMAHGLVAVVSDTEAATMIEVNCETDFVARTQKFVSLTTVLAQECHRAFIKRENAMVVLDKAVGTLVSSDGKALADRVVLEIGNIGENMALRRAVHLKAVNSTLSSYVHASGPELISAENCRLGKYGVILSLVQKKDPSMDLTSILPVERLSYLIGQHIVGMNPKCVGEEQESGASREEVKIVGEDIDSGVTESQDEERLLYQEFLLDPSKTVGSLLKDNGAMVNTFYRFECGEELPAETSS